MKKALQFLYPNAALLSNRAVLMKLLLVPSLLCEWHIDSTVRRKQRRLAAISWPWRRKTFRGKVPAAVYSTQGLFSSSRRRQQRYGMQSHRRIGYTLSGSDREGAAAQLGVRRWVLERSWGEGGYVEVVISAW